MITEFILTKSHKHMHIYFMNYEFKFNKRFLLFLPCMLTNSSLGRVKKYLFLLTWCINISVCKSCAKFVPESIFMTTWFYPIQSLVINCFLKFEGGPVKTNQCPSKNFISCLFDLKHSFGFNRCYNCTKLVQLIYDVVKTMVTRRKPNVHGTTCWVNMTRSLIHI